VPEDPSPAIQPNVHRRRASSLYGLIISGTVLATSTGEERIAFLSLSLIATLIVYWVAETYVHVMAEREIEHHELDRRTIRAIALDGLPLVTVSFLPLVVLLIARLAGLTTTQAGDVALAVNTFALLVEGYRISRSAGLRGARLALAVMLSGALGLAMIGLKIALDH